MILVGQYDSPYVRRVAISLRMLGFAYEHDTRSVFGDFEAMRAINPLGRIPSLVLDGGEMLIDSAAILDWLDETVGPDRALIPPDGRGAPGGAAADRAGDGRDRQGRRGELRAHDPARRAALAGLDRPLPRAGARRDRGARGAGLAGGPNRPGGDHHRLHDPLHRDDGCGPAAGGTLSGARRARRPLRGAAGIRGHESCRVFRAARA